MQFIRRQRLEWSETSLALSIGNFDGVHLGHQAMLRELVKEAKARHLRPAVMTFFDHPAALLSPEFAPKRLVDFRSKLQAIQACGIDLVFCPPFDYAFAQQSAQTFVEDVLIRHLNVSHLVVGSDFRFGAQRAGDFQLLQQYAPQYFTLAQFAEVLHQGERISSSRVRHALTSNQLKLAAALLGRPVVYSGRVQYGRQLGRTLGFPTLNLSVPPRAALQGTFVVTVQGLGNTSLPAVANIGYRPTVNPRTGQAGQLTQRLEVHVFGWSGPAYGRLVQVEFLEKLRDEQRFNSLEELKCAIAADCQAAQDYFQR